MKPGEPSQGISRVTVAGFVIFAAVSLVVLYPLSTTNFLLFHSMVEMFTVLVSVGIFVIAWHTRDIAENNYLTVLGTGFLYVGLTTMLHALAYKGMGVFPGADADLPTQLWVLSRLLEVAAVLVSGHALVWPIPPGRSLAGFGVLCAIGLATIFVWPVFPAMYVEGLGLTPLKSVIEYTLMALLWFSMVLLWRNRRRFEPAIANMLLTAFGLMIATEYAFTLYVTLTGPLNFIGHYFALLSFLLIYLALIETSLHRPFSLLFRELHEKQLAEHEIAEVLQGALVSAPDRVASVDFGYAFQSATTTARVGGDFYDLYALSERQVAFVIGDVCGKGIAAAAATAMLRTALRVVAYEDADPSYVLSRASDVVRRQMSPDKFVTVIFGVIDVQTGHVRMAAAGHPHPVIRRSGAPARAVELPGNPPLGVLASYAFESGEAVLEAGDMLVAFTDGCIDAGAHGDPYGIGRVVDVVSVTPGGPRAVAAAVLDSAARYAGGSLLDDVAVVGMLFTGPSGVTD